MVHDFMSVKVKPNCFTMPGENASEARAVS